MNDNDTTPTEQHDQTSDSEPTLDVSGDQRLALDRRDYLQTVGVAGVLGSLGVGAGAAGSAAAQESWENDAEARIEEHRMGDLEVVVENEDGERVADADVDIEQQEHDFGFGCMAHAEFLTRGSEWGEDIHTDEDQQRYRETLEEHFNMIVLENLHKWNIWEDNTQIADEAVEWARERDMDVRGHVALWGNIEAHAIPPRVVEAMAEDWDGENVPDDFDEPYDEPDPEYIIEESMDHIETIIEHYGDDITEWEIVNEVFHEPAMIEAIEGQGTTPETAEILGDWYEFGEEVADRYGIDIAVNDYNTLNGDHGYARDQYHDQIDYLMNERGIDLDGIGMQSHHYAHERISYDEMMTRLDEYAQYGAGLKATEFDMFGDGWDRQMQADYLYRFLKTFFSHPEAEDFLMWGHWDPVHWGPEMGDDPDAPLYEDDWTEKPAYDEYVDLVFDEWWTEESGAADSSGEYETRVFHGDHEVTVSADGETTTEHVSVTGDSEELVVTIDAEGTGDDDDDGPQDSTGDGLYNDFTGDGETTHDDVTAFFENLDDESIRNNPENFDFSNNGRVGFADVIELLRSV